MNDFQKDERRGDYCYFKNGRPKKKYMMCESASYKRELRAINGVRMGAPSCAGSDCLLYKKGCDDHGRDWIRRTENDSTEDNLI